MALKIFFVLDIGDAKAAKQIDKKRRNYLCTKDNTPEI
jgi:hypothetical protein